MLRFFLKSEGAQAAFMTAGKEMDGVYHLEQTIGNKKWNVMMREDGKGMMAPGHLPALIPFMRDHLLYSEAWAV